MPDTRDLRGDIAVAIPVPSSPVAVPVGGSFTVPYDAVITAAKWIPGAAITANGTNFFSLAFRNRVAGAGTVQFATARSYASGNSVLSTPEALTLSSTASDLNVAAGDTLTAEVTHTASGLICPGGTVMVTLRRR